MPIENPDYLRIRAKSRSLGRMWVIGDCGYYLGLVGACIAFSMLAATLLVTGIGSLFHVADKFEQYWLYVPGCLIALPICVLVVFLSAYLKQVAYRRSGIHEGEGKTGGEDS